MKSGIAPITVPCFRLVCYSFDAALLQIALQTSPFPNQVKYTHALRHLIKLRMNEASLEPFQALEPSPSLKEAVHVPVARCACQLQDTIC